MAPNNPTQEGGEPALPGNAEAGADNAAETVPVPANPGIGPAPVRPPNTAAKVNSIREGPMFVQASEIGTALIYRKKQVAKVNYRIASIQETIKGS